MRIICIELYSHVFPFRPDTDGQPNPMDITTTGYGSSKIATAASNRCRITAGGLLGVEDFSQRPRKALALQWVSLLLCQLFCQSGWENLHIELVIPTWRIGSSSSELCLFHSLLTGHPHILQTRSVAQQMNLLLQATQSSQCGAKTQHWQPLFSGSCGFSYGMSVTPVPMGTITGGP